MEWNPYLGPKMSSWMHKLEKDEEMIITLPVIPQPKTPNESMEFLARSWTPSAADITQALAQNHTQFGLSNVEPIHDFLGAPNMTNMNVDVGGNDMRGVVGKWFQGKDSSLTSGQAVKLKDKARLDNANVHAAVSIASLAAGLASVAATDKYDSNRDAGDKMKAAMASATELLASHCVHLAELAGADHDGLANAVRSSVDIRSAGDLLTLTAAAATALRAEATLRARVPKDAKKNATISPYDRSLADDHKGYSFCNEARNQDMICKGELLQQTHKGPMRWKHVTIYINKKSQVMIKIKNKHIGGAFSKKKKCVVYEVCDESGTWPFRKEKQELEEVCLGLKTGKGFLEFKCRSKIHKEKWVHGIRSLLRQVGSIELTAQFLDSLCLKMK
ncbi:hypothetical protein QQ045_006082 [Rhodiola kirilowii]